MRNTKRQIKTKKLTCIFKTIYIPKPKASLGRGDKPVRSEMEPIVESGGVTKLNRNSTSSCNSSE